jgi:hypothetical protein
MHRKIAIVGLLSDEIRFTCITWLRTAVGSDSVLDKEATSYDDVFDALRMASMAMHFYSSQKNMRSVLLD